MTSLARLAVLALLALLAHMHTVGASGALQRVPCNFTVDHVLEVAGWKPMGPRGLVEPVLECFPNGSLYILVLTDMKLSGNLSGLAPLMKDLRALDINGNRLTGERGGPACVSSALRCCCCLGY